MEKQRHDHFQAALQSRSTSPFYVIVTVVDDRNGETRTGCTAANSMAGAFHREMNRPYDRESDERVRQMISDNEDHVFHFSNPDALANVQFHYTEDDLVVAREFVQTHRDEIAAYTERAKCYPMALQRDAFICALIEEGYQVRTGCRSGDMISLGR
jgi:hypothetical protein